MGLNTDKFKSDIQKLKDCINKRDNAEALHLHRTLVGTYNHIFPKLDDSLYNIENVNSVYRFDDEPVPYREPYNYDHIYINLEILINQIELYLASMRLKASVNSAGKGSQQQTTNVNVVNEIALYVTFQEVKNKVSNMEALSGSEISEIHNKIDEISRIIDNTSLKKRDKWERLNGTIKWIADKGVDVAIALLPLLLKL